MSLQENLIKNFEAFEAQLNGHASQPEHTTRKNALEAFKTLGFPGPKNEEYKYTNLQKSLEKAFDFGKIGAEASITKEQASKYFIPKLDTHKIVFVNGKFDEKLSSIEGLEEQVVIKDLSTAFTEDSEKINKLFSKQADYKKDAFVALNTAYSLDGSFIHVPKNTVVKKPIALYFVNDASEGQSFNNPRNIFHIERNSEVTFLEDFNTEGAHESLTNIVSEIIVEENAAVEYYKLQNNKDTAYHVGTTQVHQERSSRFSAYTFTLNGAMIRNNMNIVVDGEGCESNMYGLYLINGNTHVDNHTEVDHIKPNCVSNELYKGILDDSSHGVFNGKVFVRQEAQKTNAFQSNKNILLSDTSVMNSKPQLEIWADDVKCSHGCTTGQLDEDGMFYLRARGLSVESARALMLYAFAVDVVSSIKLEPLKEFLQNLISERLQNDF
ncbi:Fe-S cluster assembly protein SufD [Fulvivirga sp. RKSG066]|uniref:Fe-S cluster assembly protein SufD n=1 Tax=Fulvivirga aurantia TaxID=2529383 RepID=UPI0012BB6EBE|nr:Fe-S cluster assembly protein SufD [Fulvivirga aurantia]MTI22673.1 Fe-S cluster assembly protein SufD [Fulvivirga aurantia]